MPIFSKNLPGTGFMYQLIDDMNVSEGPGYTDTFSNRSDSVSLRFQIDSLWIAYSDVCVFMLVFMIVFIVSV